MGSFLPLFGCHYILVAIDYVSKWVEAATPPMNNGKVVRKFLRKNIFTQFSTQRAVISDGGMHFLNQIVKNLLAKYGVRHKVVVA